MRFCSRPLGAALAIAAIAALTTASPGRAQQDPGSGQQMAPPPGTAPEVSPPDGPPPRHIARRRPGGAAVVSAKVNLRVNRVKQRVCFKIKYKNLEAQVTGAFVHKGGPGQIARPIFALLKGDIASPVHGSVPPWALGTSPPPWYVRLMS